MPAELDPSAPQGLRLSKRVAAERGCSRAEAERLIASGAVQVDGVVQDQPQTRITPEQTLHICDDLAMAQPEVLSVLWSKPAGVVLPDVPTLPWLRTTLSDSSAAPAQRSTPVWHALGGRWQCVLPIGVDDSGLVLLSQQSTVWRHVAERQALLEQEWFIDTTGCAGAEARAAALAALQAPLFHNGRPLPAARASWQSDTRIRLAIKGGEPGQVAFLAQRAGLSVQALRRQRLGRLSLSGLLPGQWRLMLPTERI